ncbi:12383_t:CDS:2 [Entrophospora sp. SA101]|nr:12383_t:CDS:2 [Entrophospora sp. SA101]
MLTSNAATALQTVAEVAQFQGLKTVSGVAEVAENVKTVTDTNFSLRIN